MANPASKALLLVTMEPPAGLEDEFNDWYDTEHFPQRRALPGFETASRWVCLSGWPRWLALYDLSSTEVLCMPEYVAVSGGNSTPWSRRLLPRTIGRLRVVAAQVAPGHALSRPPTEVARLCVAHYPTAQPDAAPDIMRRAGELSGLLQVRVFTGAGPEGAGFWAIAEFDWPLSTERIATAFEAAGGAGIKLLNVYAPYWRS